MTGPLICRRTANVADMHAGGEWCACDLERGQCHYRAQVSVTRSTPRRHRAIPGECVFCDHERDVGNSFHPSHDPSEFCESGRHPHCTCDVCF